MLNKNKNVLLIKDLKNVLRLLVLFQKGFTSPCVGCKYLIKENRTFFSLQLLCIVLHRINTQ